MTARVTVPRGRAGGTILYAGTYSVEMPADYDPALVTAEDILMDASLTIVRARG